MPKARCHPELVKGSLPAPAAKPRYLHAAALDVANELIALLQYGCGPACERIEVAGSLRRRKATVGDIELVYIPAFGRARQDDSLFFSDHANLADRKFDELLAAGVLAKRLNKNGGTAWGAQNKLAVHVASGIPVDLFATTRENWFNYLVCRTGGAENNKQIALAAQARGLKWNPYSAGFTVLGFGIGVGGHITVRSEQEVFTHAGLPYREPWERA